MNYENIYINLEDIIYFIYEGIQWYVSCKIRMINWYVYYKCIFDRNVFFIIKSIFVR